MARPCAVCIHPSRAAIEQAILNGKAASGIARDFGFTYTRRTGEKAGEEAPDHRIVTRHRDQHMGKAYATAVAEREVQSGVAIAKRLEVLDEKVDLAIEHALEGEPVLVGDAPLLNDDGTQVMRRDWRLLLAAVREGRANAELLAKLAGRTESDTPDLDAIRQHLGSPEARKLLQQLEELAAREMTEKGGEK